MYVGLLALTARYDMCARHGRPECMLLRVLTRVLAQFCRRRRTPTTPSTARPPRSLARPIRPSSISPRCKDSSSLHAATYVRFGHAKAAVPVVELFLFASLFYSWVSCPFYSLLSSLTMWHVQLLLSLLVSNSFGGIKLQF